MKGGWQRYTSQVFLWLLGTSRSAFCVNVFSLEDSFTLLFLHSLAKLRQQIQFMYMWAPKVLC